jgi:hypothetical protein
MSAGSNEPTVPNWCVYESLKHPAEQRLASLLLAVLCVLLAVKPWVSRPIGGRLASQPNWSFRRTLVALSPLFMLGIITFGYVMESRQKAAEKAMAQRKEAWKQSVERQREAVELASKQMSDASRRGKEAAEAWSKTAVRVKLPDGKIEPCFDPEAFRKSKEAFDEMRGAMKRHWDEMDRLFRLQLEEPGRYGRP